MTVDGAVTDISNHTPCLVGKLPCNGDMKDFSFSSLVEPISARISYTKQVEIYGEGEPSEYFYRVVSGTVRTYKMLADGRRQVCDFYLSGDFFGWETNGNYTVSAETISDSKVMAIKRSIVMTMAEQDKRISKCLWAMAGDDLERTRTHVLLLVKTARERVAGFLLEMAQRTQAGVQVDLPMGRQDIADYLGLTIETVSRVLRELENSEMISLASSRQVSLLNRKSLQKFGIKTLKQTSPS